jgi:hypothetical protein
VGGDEGKFSDLFEPSVRDHSGRARILIAILESGCLTVSDGQFVWGEFLESGLFNWKVNFELSYMLEPLFLQSNRITRLLKFDCKDANYKMTWFFPFVYLQTQSTKTHKTILLQTISREVRCLDMTPQRLNAELPLAFAGKSPKGKGMMI